MAIPQKNGPTGQRTGQREALLGAIQAGDEERAWALAQELARGVLEAPLVVRAKAVMQGGALAIHNAVELAEALLGDESEEACDEGSGIVRW